MWKPCSREAASGLALPTPAQTLCRLETSGPPALSPPLLRLGLQGFLLLSLEAVCTEQELPVTRNACGHWTSPHSDICGRFHSAEVASGAACTACSQAAR